MRLLLEERWLRQQKTLPLPFGIEIKYGCFRGEAIEVHTSTNCLTMFINLYLPT